VRGRVKLTLATSKDEVNAPQKLLGNQTRSSQFNLIYNNRQSNKGCLYRLKLVWDSLGCFASQTLVRELNQSHQDNFFITMKFGKLKDTISEEMT